MKASDEENAPVSHELIQMVNDPLLLLHQAILTQDEVLVEELLREYFISVDEEELKLLVDNGFVRKIYCRMKQKQQDIKRDIHDITKVIRLENFFNHVLPFLPDLRYVYLPTNDKKLMKKKIVEFIVRDCYKKIKAS